MAEKIIAAKLHSLIDFREDGRRIAKMCIELTERVYNLLVAYLSKLVLSPTCI